jgi:methionyl-tRNA formyltransferase
LRVVFLGTPTFAVPTLERLANAGHSVMAVFTQPDRPKGRDQRLAPSPVKQTAIQLGLTVFQPDRIKRLDQVELLRNLAPDAMVVVGYGQIIPQAIIDIPRLGIVNVHASLLPRYRGAAPIQWAIANDEAATGVTTMQIDAGLDTGDILLQRATAIAPGETAPELTARLADMGADLLIETLAGLDTGVIRPKPQAHSEASWAPILKKEDGLVNWRWAAARIHARWRGFQPWPGTHTLFRGQPLQIWRCCVGESSRRGVPAGTILPDRKQLLVVCGDGTELAIEEVQLQGRKRITAEAFRNGQRLLDNERL